MFSFLTKNYILALAFITFGLNTPSALACTNYAKAYKCTSKLVPKSTLHVQKSFIDGFGFYKFELSIGTLFKKQYFFKDDNKWIATEKTNIKAIFNSKTYCQDSTLVSETYTDYNNWSQRIYDDIEIIENMDRSLTINTKYWTEKTNLAKKPYQWNCEVSPMKSK